MNQFLKAILTFTIPAILGISASLFLYYNKINQLHFENNIKTIICGDSHTMRGLNDSLITNSITISQSAEMYLYTYNILAEILKNDNNIQKIVLGCSFQNFAKGRDNGITNNTNTNEMYIRYFSVLDNESRKILIKENWLSTANAMPSVYKAIAKSLIMNYNKYEEFSFIGKYQPAEINNLSDEALNSVIKRHFAYNDKFDGTTSKYQELYLDKIIDLCKQKNIKLILISTPLNYRYKNKIPPVNIDYFYNRIAKITQNNNNIIFWDYSNYKMEDKYFEDPNHLNTNGAIIFSKIIDQKLKELPQ